MEEKNRKKTRTGIVVSEAMDKTVLVEVERTVKDPIFSKYVRKRRKFMAHDEKNDCHRGDYVEITECRPLSKRKRWRVNKIIKRQNLPEAVEAV